MKTPIHLVIGQEATAVGACAPLLVTDLMYSGHRTHGAYLCKGGDLKKMLSEMHCKANGCAGSRGGSMHLIDPDVGMAWSSAIVGGAIPIATGASLEAQIKGDGQVVVVFFGDGLVRIFALYSARFDSIKVIRTGKVRRAKLYYLRERQGKSARIAERTSERSWEKEEKKTSLKTKEKSIPSSPVKAKDSTTEAKDSPVETKN